MKDFIRIVYTEPLGDNRFLYRTTDGRTFIGPSIDFKTSDTVVVEASDGPGPDGKWIISKVVDVIRHDSSSGNELPDLSRTSRSFSLKR